jgi:hypothetical protein
MRRLTLFLKRYFGSFLLFILGLALMIVAIQVLTGSLGFILFFAGAVLFIFGILITIY